MPRGSLYDSTRVLKLSAVDLSSRLALTRWSKLIDQVVHLILTGQPAVWRTDFVTTWQPFGTSTLARLIQQWTVPTTPARWIEIQNTSRQVIHIDIDTTDLAFQIQAECSRRVLGQNKKRELGEWKSKSGLSTNRMMIRIPHK